MSYNQQTNLDNAINIISTNIRLLFSSINNEIDTDNNIETIFDFYLRNSSKTYENMFPNMEEELIDSIKEATHLVYEDEIDYFSGKSVIKPHIYDFAVCESLFSLPGGHAYSLIKGDTNETYIDSAFEKEQKKAVNEAIFYSAEKYKYGSITPSFDYQEAVCLIYELIDILLWPEGSAYTEIEEYVYAIQNWINDNLKPLRRREDKYLVDCWKEILLVVEDLRFSDDVLNKSYDAVRMLQPFAYNIVAIFGGAYEELVEHFDETVTNSYLYSKYKKEKIDFVDMNKEGVTGMEKPWWTGPRTRINQFLRRIAMFYKKYCSIEEIDELMEKLYECIKTEQIIKN